MYLQTRPMKGQELAADGVLRAALGCIVIMINAGHELYAPGYEERGEKDGDAPFDYL